MWVPCQLILFPQPFQAKLEIYFKCYVYVFWNVDQLFQNINSNTDGANEIYLSAGLILWFAFTLSLQ